MSQSFGFVKRLALTLTATLALAAQASAVTIQHFKGTSEFDDTPKRVVVLGNGSLDVLDRIGVKPVGAPHSLLPEYLADYKQTTGNTGSVGEPDFEAIFTLKPDVIIAENRMLRVYDDLNQIAPTVMFYVDNGQYWQDTQANWRMLGKLFDKQDEVEALIAETQQQLDSASSKVAKQNLNALMLMNNGSNVAMFNKGSRFSIVFDDFGFAESSSKNIAPIEGSHGNLISFEYVADAQPQVIFILDREQAIGRSVGKAKELFSNPLVDSTPAAKNNKVVYIDPNAWYISGGGVTATQTMISDIDKVLN
ncbi:siderophore ABC transporter substrate-binding protein [Vibrio sp. 10N]|uniref:siderophore ABC transporter substrate-binding protein n=1 Tax=Vibrio sp. 10N TaxID=3058938 RepID=UPI002812B942|nr:siderophore ABC transporter substrate-binding protein [Vibrio sp. 10N]